MKIAIQGCALLLLCSIVSGCASGPTFVRRGNVAVNRSIASVAFDATGVKPVVEAECVRVDTAYSCSPPTNRCAADTKTETDAESTEYPCSPPMNRCVSKRRVVLKCAETPLIVRAPWGTSFEGTTASVPVHWKEIGIDPLSAEAPGKLKGKWQIRAVDGTLDHSFVPSDAAVASMLAAITGALDAPHGVESPVRQTELKLRFVPSSAPNRLVLEVSNAGDASAYQVSAHLRTGFGPLHGHEVVFGRIGPRQSKTWTKIVSVPDGEEAASPMIVAEVKASNARAASASARLRLGLLSDPESSTLDSLAVDCRALELRVAPGSKIRVQCKLKNTGKTPLKGLSYELGVHSAPSIVGAGPAELPAGGQAQIELTVLVPSYAKLGDKLFVVAAVRHRTSVRAAPPIEVVAAQDVCTGKISRAEYAAQRKKLESLYSQGGLTQADFDRYDAELVACLQ